MLIQDAEHAKKETTRLSPYAMIAWSKKHAYTQLNEKLTCVMCDATVSNKLKFVGSFQHFDAFMNDSWVRLSQLLCDMVFKVVTHITWYSAALYYAKAWGCMGCMVLSYSCPFFLSFFLSLILSFSHSFILSFFFSFFLSFFKPKMWEIKPGASSCQENCTKTLCFYRCFQVIAPKVKMFNLCFKALCW